MYIQPKYRGLIYNLNRSQEQCSNAEASTSKRRADIHLSKGKKLAPTSPPRDNSRRLVVGGSRVQLSSTVDRLRASVVNTIVLSGDTQQKFMDGALSSAARPAVTEESPALWKKIPKKLWVKFPRTNDKAFKAIVEDEVVMPYIKDKGLIGGVCKTALVNCGRGCMC